MRLPPNQTQEILSEEEEEEGEISEDEETDDDDNDATYEEANDSDDASESISGSIASSDLEEDHDDATTSVKALKGIKRGRQVKQTAKPAAAAAKKVRQPRITLKLKKPIDDGSSNEKKEKKHDAIEEPEKIDEKKVKKAVKRSMPSFSDKNCDFDLFNQSSGNVVARKVKLTNSLLITCRMIEANNQLTYDYPALTFQRKTKGEKMFEFTLPLQMAPKIIEAIDYIVKENPKFFKH